MTHRLREVATPLETVSRILGQCRGEYGSEPVEIRVPGTDRRRGRTEVLADDDGRTAVREWRGAGEHVVGGCGQGVLVGVAVHLFALELLGCGVVHCSDRHIGTGQITGLADPTGNPEVHQHDSAIS